MGIGWRTGYINSYDPHELEYEEKKQKFEQKWNKNWWPAINEKIQNFIEKAPKSSRGVNLIYKTNVENRSMLIHKLKQKTWQTYKALEHDDDRTVLGFIWKQLENQLQSGAVSRYQRQQPTTPAGLDDAPLTTLAPPKPIIPSHSDEIDKTAVKQKIRPVIAPKVFDDSSYQSPMFRNIDGETSKWREYLRRKQA